MGNPNEDFKPQIEEVEVINESSKAPTMEELFADFQSSLDPDELEAIKLGMTPEIYAVHKELIETNPEYASAVKEGDDFIEEVQKQVDDISMRINNMLHPALVEKGIITQKQYDDFRNDYPVDEGEE